MIFAGKIPQNIHLKKVHIFCRNFENFLNFSNKIFDFILRIINFFVDFSLMFLGDTGNLENIEREKL
jgi:hypothetical protein